MSHIIDNTPVKLPENVVPKKTHYLDKALESVKNEVGETSSINRIVKVAHRTLNLVSAALQTVEHAAALGFLSFFSKVFTVFNGVSSFVNLISQAVRKIPHKAEEASYTKRDRILQVISSVVGVAIGALASLQILEIFGVFKLASFTQSLAQIPVLGASIALAPITPFILLLEILQLGIGIGTTSHTIYHTQKKETHAAIKEKEWKALSSDTIESRIKYLKTKKDSELARASVVQKQRDATRAQTLDQTQKYQLTKLTLDSATGMGKIPAKLNEYAAKRMLMWTAKNDTSLCSKLEEFKTHLQKIERREAFWTTLRKKLETGTLTETEKADLDILAANKLSKWNMKQVKFSWDQIKETGSLMLSTVIIVGLIASTILFFTGVGAFASAVTMASLFLLTTVVGLGLYLFKKYHKNELPASIGTIDLGSSEAIQEAT